MLPKHYALERAEAIEERVARLIESKWFVEARATDKYAIADFQLCRDGEPCALLEVKERSTYSGTHLNAVFEEKKAKRSLRHRLPLYIVFVYDDVILWTELNPALPYDTREMLVKTPLCGRRYQVNLLLPLSDFRRLDSVPDQFRRLG